MEDVERRFLEKIAKLDLAGVSVGEIAHVVNRAESYVYQLMASADYSSIKATLSSAEFEKQELLANGWDSIQAKALSIVNNHLDWTKDPDFALKAAAVANKADKPGKRFGRQIDATQAATATVSLTVEFVNKIQQSNGKLIEHIVDTDAKKVNNVLDISKTEELLKPALAPSEAEEIADSLGNFRVREAV